MRLGQLTNGGLRMTLRAIMLTYSELMRWSLSDLPMAYVKPY